MLRRFHMSARRPSGLQDAGELRQRVRRTEPVERLRGEDEIDGGGARPVASAVPSIHVTCGCGVAAPRIAAPGSTAKHLHASIAEQPGRDPGARPDVGGDDSAGGPNPSRM